MIKHQPRKDVDEEILKYLSTRKLTPRELRKGIPKTISRATYFRRKKKLVEQRKIEELKLMGEDGKYHKFLRAVSPGLMANQQDIELYLDQMENPIREICARGYRFFAKLCNSKRVAWYFSPTFSPNPNFRSEKDVEDFFRKKFWWKEATQLDFLNALNYMFECEPEGSFWKKKLIDCTQEFIEELVRDRTLMTAGVRAFRILRKFPGKLLHELAIDLIIELNDGPFDIFYGEIVYTLLESKEAKERKYLIRRKLDDLAAQNAKLRGRVEKILQQAKP